MHPNYIYGKNEWVGSEMQTYLNDNGDYYLRTGTASTYGLKENAKTLINNAKYYLGGMHYDNTTGYGTADAMYLWERGEETFSYENYCLYGEPNDTKCTTANYCENNPTDEICTATRSKFWVGEVALMYLSDYALVYANGVDAVCYGNPNRCQSGVSDNYGTPSANWIYNSNNLEGQNNIYTNWLVSPNSTTSYYAFYVYYEGYLGSTMATNSNGVRPVLYLSSNVKITDGTGESTNPYKLGL